MVVYRAEIIKRFRYIKAFTIKTKIVKQNYLSRLVSDLVEKYINKKGVS